MVVAALKKETWALIFTLFTSILLFFISAAHYWADSERLLKAAGFIGIICASSAIYTAFGEILNEIYGTTILPLGKAKINPKIFQALRGKRIKSDA